MELTVAGCRYVRLPEPAPCRACGRAPAVVRSRCCGGWVFLVECRERSCGVAPVAVGPDPRSAVDAWNRSNGNGR